MPEPSASKFAASPAPPELTHESVPTFSPFPPAVQRTSGPRRRPAVDDLLADDAAPVDWSEEDVVFLHWRLLQEISRLAEPGTPLEEKFDTLRWIFTEREKDERPFSFVNCLRVVGCSPLSPIAYCGRMDAEELRDQIRRRANAWIGETVNRYPDWVREAIATNPAWVEASLAKNPQWINEQIKRMEVHGDLFA